MQTTEKARRVFRGNYAELWLSDRRIAELTGFKAEVSKRYNTVDLCGDTWEYQRKISQSGTGTMDLYRVDSFTDVEEVAALETGADPIYTVISKINDPDSAGAERWAFFNVHLENITLADFKAKNFAQRSVKFHFAGCEPLDSVKAE